MMFCDYVGESLFACQIIPELWVGTSTSLPKKKQQQHQDTGDLPIPFTAVALWTQVVMGE